MTSIANKRNAVIGWIVWRLAKRRARRAMPSAVQQHPRAAAIGGSALLAGAGAFLARRGVSRLRGRAAGA